MHPDGRVQRLRPAIGRPRPLDGRAPACARAGRSSPTSPPRRPRPRRRAPGAMASQPLFDAVPFYAGLTLDEIGGRGVRWPEREAAAAAAPAWEPATLERRRRAAPRAQRARCASAPSARCGLARRSTSRPRCASCAPRRSSSCRPPTPSGSASATATRSRSASNGTRVRAPCGCAPRSRRLGVPRRGRARAADALTEPLVEVRRSAATPTGRDAVPRGRRRAPRARRWRSRHRAASHSRARTHEPLATVGYYEPWWIQLLKALVIFAVVFQLVPIVLLAERKMLGRFQHRYGPNRVGPFGVLQPMADIGKLLFKQQFRPRTLDRLAVRARARDLDDDRGRDDGDHPVLRHRRHLRHAGRALRDRPEHRDPLRLRLRRHRVLRADARRLGVGLASTRSSARCAPPRSSSPTRSSQGLALIGVVMMAGTLSLTEIVEAQERAPVVRHPAVRRLHHLPRRRLRRDQPRRRSTSPRPTPSSSAATSPSTAAAASPPTSPPSTSTSSSSPALTATLFLGGWNVPFVDPPTWVDPIVVLVKMLRPRLLLHLGARHAAAPALRPADVAGLEGLPAARDAQCPRDRDPVVVLT